MEEMADTYRNLADASPDPTFLLNLDTGRIADVNERTTTLLGYDRSAIVGQPVTAVHPDDEADQYRELFASASERETFRFERLPSGERARLVAADGTEIPVSVNAKRVEIDDTPHVFSIVRDLSDQVETQRRLERTSEQLAVLNRLVRHDIRNDMSVILGWADRLPEADEDERAAIVDRIQTHGRHVVSLTELAREYVAVITGETEPALEPTALAPLLRDTVASTHKAYPDADVGIADDAALDVTVVATPLLESVFRNLVVNAVQHNDSETPCVRVDVDADETVTVRVVDNGPGVPDDRKEALFGRGEVGLDSDGSGIGLYLVEQLVTQFGGRVEVLDREPATHPLPADDSRRETDGPAGRSPAVGTVFVVELERADDEQQDPGHTDDEPGASGSADGECV